MNKLSNTRAERIATLEKQVNEQNDKINYLTSWLLSTRLQEAEKERKEGNEERAINLLHTGVEALRPDMAACCLELALHHLSLFPDYGEQHVQEAENLARIAVLLHPANSDAQAIHRDILAVASGIEYDQSNHVKSDELWNEASDYLKPNNKDSLETIETLSQIADHHREKGNYRVAERIFRRAYMICKRRFGNEGRQTLILRGYHAFCLGTSGRYLEALASYKVLHQEMDRILGKDHPDVLLMRGNVAIWTGAMGNNDQALSLFKGLLPDAERILGKDHENTLWIRGNIAKYTHITGDGELALTLLKALLPEHERARGKNHHDTFSIRCEIAQITGQMGDNREALVLLEALLLDVVRIRGKNHPETIPIRHEIGVITSKMGNNSEALALLKVLLQDAEQILGKDHPHTIIITKSIENQESNEMLTCRSSS